MNITPREILEHEFGESKKGYNHEEVKNFLGLIAQQIENDNIEKDKLLNEIYQLNEKKSKLEKREEILKETLISAQKFAVEVKKNAEKEAEIIIKEAEIKGEEIVKASFNRVVELKEGIKFLKTKRKEIENNLIASLNTCRDLVADHLSADEEWKEKEY